MGRAQGIGTSATAEPRSRQRQTDSQFAAAVGVKRGAAAQQPARTYDRHCQAYVWALPDGSYHRLDGPAIEFRGGARKGETQWYREGLLHRQGGPAVERADGSEDWYQEGALHRDGGPALRLSDGTQIWVKGGQLHRRDGPAVVRSVDYENGWPLVDLRPLGYNGQQISSGCEMVELQAKEEWRVDGQLHREDGPALMTFQGTKAWSRHGKLHREDGPAIEIAEEEDLLADGGTLERGGRSYDSQEWWLDGELHRENGPAISDNDGVCFEWYRHGQLHREDGPAIELADGNDTETRWYYEDELHREDGPAIEESDGRQEWWIKGLCHRENGPAVIESDGTEIWYLNGVVHRDGGPAIDNKRNIRVWVKNGELHREDGPAIEQPYWIHDGDEDAQYSDIETLVLRPFAPPDRTNPLDLEDRAQEEWWLNGKLHREDGPARTLTSARTPTQPAGVILCREWWVDGQLHRKGAPAIEFEDANADDEWYEHGQKCEPPQARATSRTVRPANCAQLTRRSLDCPASGK